MPSRFPDDEWSIEVSGPHINELAPKHHHLQPREMAVGLLTEEATIDSVVESLAGAGIDADRLYFMHGQEAIDLVEDALGFFGRLFDQDREKPLAALQAGATLVGVIEVSHDDIDDIRAKLIDAKVLNRLYFGKWTIE